MSRSVPRCALLRARHFRADPLALSPLSLPGERRTRFRFDGRRCTFGATALSRARLADTSPVGVAPCEGTVVCDPLARLCERLTGAVPDQQERQRLSPLVP